MLKLIKEISKKSRVAGTEQCNKVRDILIKKLESLGHQIEIQKLPFIGWEVIVKPKLKINNKNIEVLPVIWSGSTKGILKGILKETSSIKTFEAYKWIRYKIVDGIKTKGYVITRPDIIWLQLIDQKSKLPYFMVHPKTYKKIKDKKNIKIEASIKSKFIKNQFIYNIITKNNSKKKIIVCAYYDSILNAPGANDNASGVGALMEIAKTNKNIQYILFSAEEFNKYGSYSYVRLLKKEQLKKIKLLINIDMVGCGKPFCICSKKIQNTIKKILPKTTQIITHPSPPFDYWPFYKKGVDVVFFWSVSL
ncbi:M28 family peptidase [Candidatus Kuenenbacteria bacterium]|nr:M28 family peptidase [Candidatus Kuenenbacteria bacterium]